MGQRRLNINLLIGLLMGILALAGYLYFGPDWQAMNKDHLRRDYLHGNVTAVTATPQAGHSRSPLMSVPTRTPAAPAADRPLSESELAELQAHLEEMARQIEALNTGNGSGNGISSP